MNSHDKQLDTRIEIVTPENIAFEYRLAGPFRRLGAYLLDLLVRVGLGAAALVVLGLVFGFAGLAGFGVGFWLALVFFLTWFYGGLFETLWNGQTPGKRLMGIRVLSADGRAINAMQAVMRNLLRAVDAQPGWSYLLGLVTASASRRFARLGDLACGTMVVIEERQWLPGVVRIHDPAALRLAAELPAGFQPSRSLGRALAMYVGRRAVFPPARRMQIAAHLGVPLRRKLDLPPSIDSDQLLSALYHRTFVTDRLGESALREENPFANRHATGQPGGATRPAALLDKPAVAPGEPGNPFAEEPAAAPKHTAGQTSSAIPGGHP